MKKVFLLFLSCWFVFQASAQKYDDLGINFPSLIFSQKIDLSYEKAVAKEASIIGEIAYGNGNSLSFPNGMFDTLVFSAVDTNFIIREQRSSSQTNELSASLGLRYYFWPDKGTDLFYVGLGFQYDTYTSIEENYPEEEPKDRIWIRLDTGHKWILRDRVPLEVGVGILGRKVSTTTSDFGYFDVGVKLLLKTGYRFGVKQQE